MKSIETLKPFTRFCCTIGNLPTSYMESLTYEEQLLWLCNYLENTVIPAVNNNAEAVKELQDLYVVLKDYVDNYFNNIDVQEEINNKLDQMAADGSLYEIIKKYTDPIVKNQDKKIETIETKVNNDIANQNLKIENINNKVNNAVSGSPLVATNVSEMTDTSRVYVNTTDGKWYYYDGNSWTIGGVYQSTAIDENDPTIIEIKRDIKEISENKENMYTESNVQVGINWTGGQASNRAVEYVSVKPNTKYTIELIDYQTFPNVGVFEKANNQGASPILVNQYVRSTNPKIVIVTSINTNYICFQFEKDSDITQSDFKTNTIIVFEGESPLYCAYDKIARKQIEEATKPFDTFKKLVESRLTGKHRFSGYEMRTKVPYKPYVYEHKQDAHPEPYYNVNYTLSQYYQTSESKLTKNICNNLEYEDIDFTPVSDGFTRIIVGKNDDDLFFVSYVASDRKGQFGDGKYDKLEVTKDFKTFKTILKSDQNNIDTDGLILPNMTNIKVVSVKEFADSSYILAIRCKDYINDTNYTHFYRMNKDFTSINHSTYVDFNGNTSDMIDEYNNDVYDWHIFVSGEKCLATTYGNRNPETDKGRVWYTENNGYSWKQIFQTSNHLPENVHAHTHGVMIDSYTNRLYVIIGENDSSVYYSDKGYNTTDNDWTKINLKNMPCYNFQTGTQVVNAYPFKDSIIFGSDNEGVGAIYRMNKLDDGNLSYIEPAHEFLPNKYNGTFYCSAEMSRKNSHNPLFICETHENARLTEEDNELLNKYNKARVLATMDGVHFVEIWTDDTYGERTVYINKSETTRRYSMCTRGMNFWLLNNGNALMKFSGRDYQYFGGSPLFSVVGNTDDSCHVRIFKGLKNYI